QAEDGIRDWSVTGVQTCALPISRLALVDGAVAPEGRGDQIRRDAARRVGDRETVEIRAPRLVHGTGVVGEGHERALCAGVRDDQIGRASCREEGRWRGGADD